MKEKIVLVLPKLPVYRNEFLKKVYEKLSKKNKELIIIIGTNKRKKEVKEIEDNLPFLVIKNTTIGFNILNINFNWQKNLIKDVIGQKPEKVVLMLHSGIINYLFLLIFLKLKNIPYILWGSGYNRIDLNKNTLKFKTIINSFFEKMASGYITYSQYFADNLIKKGYNKEKIITAQNTINIEKIIAENENIHAAREYKKIQFLFVGALIPEKKLDKSIVACKKLVKKGYDFKYDIIGGGRIEQDLKELVNNYDLSSFITIHGPKYGDDLIKFFRKSNVFLLPGTGGLAINEAMAYSLPIISTPGDGTVYDLVKNNKNGFLMNYNYKITQLVKLMEYFINADKHTIEEMGNNSLDIIKEKATLQNMAEKFVFGIEKFK